MEITSRMNWEEIARSSDDELVCIVGKMVAEGWGTEEEAWDAIRQVLHYVARADATEWGEWGDHHYW